MWLSPVVIPKSRVNAFTYIQSRLRIMNPCDNLPHPLLTLVNERDGTLFHVNVSVYKKKKKEIARSLATGTELSEDLRKHVIIISCPSVFFLLSITYFTDRLLAFRGKVPSHKNFALVNISTIEIAFYISQAQL